MNLVAHCSRTLRLQFARFALTLGAFAEFITPALAQTNQALPLPSRLVMSQGIVEVRKVGSDFWTAARARQIFQPGDRLRTGERSRAEVYLSGGMTVQKGEFSEMEMPPSPEPTLKRGLFKIFNRETTKGTQFGLPNSTTAAIRGTDFIVKVDELGDAEVTVLDGEVVLRNLKGEVALA